MKENLNITKKESKKMILIWKIISKYMENVSFYRLRCGTIAWWTKEIVGGQPLIWWLVFDIVGCWFLKLLADFWYCWLAKTSLLTSEFEPFVPWKLWAIVSAFQQKKPELIWTSRTQDMSWKPNSVWAAGQVPTSPLFLRFELENGRIESWTLMKVLGLCLIFPSI